EALTNSLRHAHGTTVMIQMRVAGRHLQLVIADDGRGFDVRSPSLGGQHNGLGNLHRRAAAVNGQLQVTSEPGKGTRIELKLDLPE
ncbi:MAG TPA: ATP-binding protein, partial [Verrucomicrobiae bacterium]